jgi:hypothetical protein
VTINRPPQWLASLYQRETPWGANLRKPNEIMNGEANDNDKAMP